MVVCPKCSRENDDGAAFCSGCGQPLTGIDSPWGETRVRPESDINDSGLGLWDETVIGPERPQTSFEPGQVIANRYEVIRELGRGGMGIVYLVRDQMIGDREVALKLIHPALVRHDEARRRFTDEVVISQELTHPNIVKVFHLDAVGDQPFFSMEYVPGHSLREEIENRQRAGQTFTVTETARVIDQVLDALDHAHLRTIHRDIKPDNIMLVGDWPDVTVKVMDFGIAKTLSPSRMTTTAQSMGTAYYMAPEQLAGAKNVTPASDLYAVGAVLYEMLTGEVPAGRFALPGELVDGLPPALDHLVDRALQAKPENRFGTAAEFRSALDEVAAEARNRELEAAGGRRQENEHRLAEEVRQQKVAATASQAGEAEPHPIQAGARPARRVRLAVIVAVVVLVIGGGVAGLVWNQARVAREKRISGWLTSAKRSLKAGRLAEAGRYYTLASNEDGTNIESQAGLEQVKVALWQKAKAAFANKDYVGAERHYLLLKKYFPGQAGVAESLVRVKAALKRKARQIRDLLARADQAKKNGKVFEAEKLYRQVLSISANNQAGRAGLRKIKALKAFTNTIGMKFVLIPAGSFMMGSPATEQGRYPDEGPQHRVTISRPFYVQTTEVTQAQWRAIMGTNPSHFKGCDRCPVERVSCNDAQEFISRLNAREGNNKYRLPTEAEWEYACRAGTRTPFYFGETISTDQANYDGRYVYGSGQKGVYRQKTTAEGSFRMNGWGLYDIYGNVWEWCSDWYAKDYYSNSPTHDPQGPSYGNFRVLRGGSWLNAPRSLRSADRFWADPRLRATGIGFRVVRTF